MASLVGDYEQFSKTRNITFIGINMSRTANAKTVAAQVNDYKLKPFPNMVDAAGATAHAYAVPKNAPNWLTVIGPDGKIAYNASKGWRWGANAGPLSNKFCHMVAIEESIAKSTGILGIDKLPDEFLPAAHIFDIQQFFMIEPELKRAQSQHPLSSETKACFVAFHERIAASRKARVERIKTLSESNPLQGYREAVAFVQAFTDAPERNEVNDLGKKLLKDKTVKRELQAEDGYVRILVPIMSKTSSMKSFETDLKPTLDQYLKAYKDTDYAKIAEAAVNAHGEAIRNPNH